MPACPNLLKGTSEHAEAAVAMSVIVALAGRRIDAANAREPRFPLNNVDRVKDELEGLLVRLNAVALVSSAACGADLLGLQVAGQLGLRRRIVLPFGAWKFRDSSVVDRPGPWGELFDAITAQVESQGDLVVLSGKPDADQSYAAANALLVEEAMQLAHESQDDSIRCAAAVVWEGTPRPGTDLTAQFAGLARAAGWPVYEVITR